MKVIQAFSWMLFILYVLALYVLMRLVTEAHRFGRFDIWWAPIRGASCYTLLGNMKLTQMPVELPWFGEAPGYYNTHPGGMMQYPAGGYAYPAGGQAYPAMQGVNAPLVQTPGHSIIIQPGMNGQPPTITQVPLGAV